jgi:hypothetical protein
VMRFRRAVELLARGEAPPAGPRRGLRRPAAHDARARRAGRPHPAAVPGRAVWRSSPGQRQADVPSSAIRQCGLCATSHGWPSGSANTPCSRPMPWRRLAQHRAARRDGLASTASTSAGERTLCASVTPP